MVQKIKLLYHHGGAKYKYDADDQLKYDRYFPEQIFIAFPDGSVQ
jgi:hypothetical protein